MDVVSHHTGHVARERFVPLGSCMNASVGQVHQRKVALPIEHSLPIPQCLWIDVFYEYAWHFMYF